MAQINLAPGSQYLIAVRRRRRMIYGTAATLALIVIIVGTVLSIMVNRTEAEKQSLQQQLQSVETQIAQASEKITRIQQFEQRLTTLNQLMQNHRTWTLYAQELERLLPPDTILTDMKGDYESGTIEISGSTPNIDSAALALASLKNQPVSHETLFTDGTIKNVTQEVQADPNGQVTGQRYDFKMNLTFSPTAPPTP